MSAAKRVALVISIALLTLALSAAAVLAQGSAPNPSGGTSIHPPVEDSTGPIGLGRFLSSGFTLDLRARGWLIGYAASRFTVSAARPAAGPAVTAVMPRKIWGR